MRRATALFALLVTLTLATPTYAASRDRDFGSRFRNIVSKIVHLFTGSTGDTLTPPKP